MEEEVPTSDESGRIGQDAATTEAASDDALAGWLSEEVSRRWELLKTEYEIRDYDTRTLPPLMVSCLIEITHDHAGLLRLLDEVVRRIRRDNSTHDGFDHYAQLPDPFLTLLNNTAGVRELLGNPKVLRALID